MSHLVIRPETPRSLGYAMPAEWSRHRATWLSWPHNRETWPTQLERVREVWVRMIQLLSPQERVCLLVNDEPTRQDVIRRLTNARAALDNVTIFQIPTVDVWMRDYGPTFVIRDSQERALAFNDCIFNGWGGKYESYEEDEQIAKEIASLLRVPVFNHLVVLEGGSIEVNGKGTVLTTEQCLLNKNRNPHLSRREIEDRLKEHLDVREVLWLKYGIAGDDTDGHIDDVARFVNENTVLCALENDASDDNYEILRDNYDRLKSLKMNVIPLPMPGYVGAREVRLPASYANFYIGNDAVVVPVFGHPNDQRALDIIQGCFSTRIVVGVNAAAMVYGLGTIHCCSQQEPREYR